MRQARGAEGLRSPLRFSLGLLAGLGVTGLLHGAAQLVSPEAGWLRESITLAAGGNLLGGLVLVPLVYFVWFLRRPQDAWTMGRGMLCGLAIGVLPIIGTLAIRLELYRGHATVALWLAPLLLISAAMVPRKFVPGPRASLLALFVALVSWFWTGGRGLEPAFEVDAIEGSAAQRANFMRTGGPQVSASQPDIVLISLDTLRADAVYGEHRAKVPHLDALAARGMSAPYARSGSNCTLPGHVEMFTGVGPLRHGVLNNSAVTPDDLPILGELFADAGWNTCAVISNRVIEQRFGPSRGFELWHDSLGTAHNHLARLGENTLLGWLSDRSLFEALYPVLFFGEEEVQLEWGAREAERTAQTAIARINELAPSPRPFFLVVQFMDAHDPYFAPAEWRGTRSAAPGPSVPGFDEDRARYWEEVDYLDSQLGRVFAALDATQRPYVLLVTGDHGEHLDEQSMLGHSDELFEPVVRVPFFLAGPGLPQAKLLPVSLTDVAPTLLACAGLAIPLEMEGIDLRRRLAGYINDERFVFGRDERSVSAVVGPYKWSADWPRSSDVPTVGIFRNLLEDPSEQGPPLTPPPPGVLEEIKRRLSMAILRDDKDLNPERRAALAELGYVDSAKE
jgi:arylsulfatase A-like enzyme